jgi:hypothetical protein
VRESYDVIIQAGIFKDDYCMPYENDLPVWICKNRRVSLKDDWAKIKHYD